MVTISKNKEKVGIELSFPTKPTDEVLSWLKSKGFAWSRFSKVWWRKWNEYAWKDVHEYFNQPIPEIIPEDDNKTASEIKTDDQTLFHGVTANEFILLDITASLKAFARNEALRKNKLFDKKDILKASLIKKKLMLKNGAINDMGRVVRKQIIASGDYNSSSYYSGYDKFIAAHWKPNDTSPISIERPSAWITNTTSWNAVIRMIMQKHGGTELEISEQINLGREIEKEHTADSLEQTRIAYDHLWEDPKYYTKAKPANWAEKELEKENKTKELRVIDYQETETRKVLDFEYDGGFYSYQYNKGKGWGFAFVTEYSNEHSLTNKLTVSDSQSRQIYSTSEPDKNTKLGSLLQTLASEKAVELKVQQKKADPEKPIFWKWTRQQYRDYWIKKYEEWVPEKVVTKSDYAGKWYATRPDGNPTTGWATKKLAIERIAAERVSMIAMIKNGNLDWEHKAHIENAIKAGEEIPAKVLADYPEFNKQASPAPEPASTTKTPGTIRPEFSDILKGRDIEISMPNGEKRKAYFAITELDDIIASHNEENFHSEPAYPKNASGNNINDRNYKDDLSAQKAVMDYARELEPERLITTSRTPSGTPIITKDGFVVSGNNRTMSLKLAAKSYPVNYKEYVDFLISEIDAYGFSGFKISMFEVGGTIKGYTFRDLNDQHRLGYTFTHPVLVRIDLDFPEYTTQELAKYNKDTKKAERPVDKAIKLSNILRENSRCADIIAEITGEYETFTEFYSNIAGQKKLAKTLVECNLLTEQEMPAYFSDTTFTETGKEFIENLLAALILDREALMAAEQPGIKAIRQKLITSLPVLMKNASLPEGSLKSYINDAVIFQHIMKTSGSEFIDFIRQANLFGTNYNRKTVYMNRLINQGKLVFKSCIEKYNAAVMINQGPTLFGTKPSNDDLFNQFIKKYIDPTEQRLIEKSDVVSREEIFGTFAGQVPVETMEKAWKDNTPIKEVFETAGKDYPQEIKTEKTMAAKEYFTKENAPDNIKDRFGVSKTQDRAIIEAVPKTFNSKLKDGEEVYIVDGKYVRDNIYSDFSQGGNDMAYPEFVPIGELWVEEAMIDEKDHILTHEKRERDLMVNAGYIQGVNETEALTYEEAHEIVKDQEDKERGIEAKSLEKMTDKPKSEVTVEQFAKLRKWISSGQIEALMSLIRSEEREAGIEIINNIIHTIETMPKTYETENIKTDEKIVYLHYFSGGSDFYIVERDKEVVQYQAFGYSILNGDNINAEWGYISIVELIQNNAELDFYWEPRKFSEVIEKKGKREEVPELSKKEQLLKHAEQLGKSAFLEGKTRVPAQDINIMEMLKGKPVGSPLTAPLLDAWFKGWDGANLANDTENIEPENTSGSRSEFLSNLHELDMWRFFPEPEGKGREYRKFILHPGNERAVTDLGIKESMRDTTKGGKPYTEAIISVRMGDEKTKQAIEEAYQENTGTKITLNQPVKLPVVIDDDKSYYVDFKLQEIRDVDTAERVPFTDIFNETLKSKIRAIRAEFGQNVNMPGLDDEVKTPDQLTASSKRIEIKSKLIPSKVSADALIKQLDNKIFFADFSKTFKIDWFNQNNNIVSFVFKNGKEGKIDFSALSILATDPLNDKTIEKQLESMLFFIVQQYKIENGLPNIEEIVPKPEESVSKTDISVTKSDYKNEFDLNKAIETLLDRKWNDKRESWSDDELAFIKRYTGYGGLDDESKKAGVKLDVKSLFEYFTPDQVIEKMWGLAYRYGYKDGPILEPSCGIGPFFDRRFVSNTIEKHGYEINKYSAKICKLLYPEAIINDGEEIKYFEQLFIVKNYTVRGKVSPKYKLVIGNPPYGTVGGIYMGMGEKSYTHANNYIDYFILRGLDLLEKGGLLIYIIGAETAGGGVPFLDQNMNKVKEMINERGKLIDAYRLPSGVFARTDVTSDIVVFRKR